MTNILNECLRYKRKRPCRTFSFLLFVAAAIVIISARKRVPCMHLIIRPPALLLLHHLQDRSLQQCVPLQCVPVLVQ